MRLKWLGGWAVAIATMVVVYKVLSRVPAIRTVVHRILMSLPVIGRCMQSFAIARFSWAFYLHPGGGTAG